MNRVLLCALMLSLILLASMKDAFASDNTPASPAGFIALSSDSDTDTLRNWDKAKAYCAGKGGKVPLINGGTSWNGQGSSSIDGFGAVGDPWPSGVPIDPYPSYWTGTEFPGGASLVWFVIHVDGKVVVSAASAQASAHRAICVP